MNKKKRREEEERPCGDSEAFSHSAHWTGVAAASSGTTLLQDKD